MKRFLLTNTIVVAILLFSYALSFGQDNKKNYVSPTSSDLKIERFYDNPMRQCYHIGANIGASFPNPQPAVFWEITGSFAPKHFIFMGNFQKDMLVDILAGKKQFDFIKVSGNKEIGERSNPVNEMGFSVGINFKDETTIENIKPTVGIQVTGTDVSGNVKTTYFYEYYTDYEVSTRYTSGLNLGLVMQGATLYYDTAKAESSRVTFKDNSSAPKYNYYLPYKTTSFTLGWIYTVTTGYKAKFTYRDLKKQKHRSDQIFISGIDFMYAPLVTWDKEAFFTSDLDENVILTSLVKDAKVSPFGARMYSTQSFGNLPGLYYRAELGFRPGIYFDKKDNFNNNDEGSFQKFINTIGKAVLTPPWYLKMGIGISL